MAYGPLLIVDDEPQNLALMRQILAPHFRLVFANSGNEALSAASRHRPALVLLDVQMPDVDGYEVCRALKNDPRTASIPVIFVTGLADIGNEAAGFAAGAVDYICKPISPEIVLARVNTHLSLVRATELEASYRDAIAMLAEAGHYNDSDTGVHIWRMAAYARVLAQASGWVADHAAQLELAAPMHDTGKIGIPDQILCKPAKLDADEWVIMKTHPQIGYDILSKSEAPVMQLAAEVALRHHEKWDGSGYPDGLAGAAIPESARIVAIADVFDALTMKRPYKDPWPLDQVLANLRDGAGGHFESRLVQAFLDVLPQILDIKAHWDDREESLASAKASEKNS